MRIHDERLQEFRTWCQGQEIEAATLVQYSGPEFVGEKAVGLDDLEQEAKGCIDEGFRVEWYKNQRTCLLCVIESWDERIDWGKVIRKESFVDVNAILRSAGFDAEGTDG
ncbi:MAG: hypothetical protein HQ515_07020 [Phycisphaeraceae bacterium]|nr:hypothetical protein [Phycisphaeraceae bacterium]